MAFMQERSVSSDGKRVMTVEQFKRWLKTMTVEQFKRWLKTSVDTNGDGRINKAELREAFRLTGGLFASWKSHRAFKSADANHDGFIDENEFRKLAQFAEKHLNVRITQ